MTGNLAGRPTRLATPLSRLLPTGGLAAGAPEAQRIDEAFHHLRRITKVLLPILRQPFAGPLQDLRGQIGPLARSGQGQKAGILRDQMPPLLDLARRPVQPLVPQFDMKRLWMSITPSSSATANRTAAWLPLTTWSIG